ncbi:hypothetical protein KIW84_051783 [Lathyrus oleraceus]|uniref:GRF-type domain-containing protein n=1 Tax=Pisum sativum TaxID=3888 RepID=A0A9D5AE29_PEA|nr:hypothetical protein KIW84_051783 [Pisum sativum]
MFKNASSASITSFGTSGSVFRRNKIIECFCQDDSVLHTVTDVNSVNYGRIFLDCINYRNHIDKGCNFFKWLGDEFVDEGDLKLERQKKKINKLKNEVIHTKGWLKMSVVVKMLSLGLNLVFVTKVTTTTRNRGSDTKQVTTGATKPHEFGCRAANGGATRNQVSSAGSSAEVGRVREPQQWARKAVVVWAACCPRFGRKRRRFRWSVV